MAIGLPPGSISGLLQKIGLGKTGGEGGAAKETGGSKAPANGQAMGEDGKLFGGQG